MYKLMAETVTIKERNGVAPGSNTSLTGKVGRFCTMDSAEPGTTNPCKVPTTLFNYSFWKTQYADIAGSGWTSIRDIYWYCDGNVATDWGLDSGNGGGMVIGARDDGENGLPISVAYHGSDHYQQATGTVGTTGDAISTTHAYYSEQSPTVVNADTKTANAAHLIDSTVYSAAFISKAWVTQLKIPPTASHGEMSSKTFTISYTVY
jgi:hypothetical protein